MPAAEPETRAVPARSPTQSKAKGTGEVDQVLQRDKSVVSQLLKASAQEKNNTECCTPAKAKLQEALLGQNRAFQEHKERGREGQEVPTCTWACEGMGPLQAEPEGLLRPHFRSWRDQLQQLLQVLNSVCDLPRISMVSLFAGPFLLPQFTRRQRGISTMPPSPSRQSLAWLRFNKDPVQY